MTNQYEILKKIEELKEEHYKGMVRCVDRCRQVDYDSDEGVSIREVGSHHRGAWNALNRLEKSIKE